MRRQRRDVGEGVHARLSILLIMVGIGLLPRPASGWQSTLVGITGDGFNRAQALDVVLAPDHELVVVGSNHFVIVKLAAATGDEIWRHDLGPGAAVATAVDAAGDVVAAGAYLSQFTVVKVSGATGTELWRRELTGSAQDSAASDVALTVRLSMITVPLASAHTSESRLPT